MDRPDRPGRTDPPDAWIGATPGGQERADEPSVRPGVRLGVDVGEVRVGLAASDPAGILATPVATLPRDRATFTDLQSIVEQAREREAIEVVVGLPRMLSGAEGSAARSTRDYAVALRARLNNVSVRLFDERLSTVDAHRSLHASGVSGRQHRARVDQVAAVVILQAALDTERNTGRPAGEEIAGRKPRAKRPSTTSEGNQP